MCGINTATFAKVFTTHFKLRLGPFDIMIYVNNSKFQTLRTDTFALSRQQHQNLISEIQCHKNLTSPSRGLLIPSQSHWHIQPAYDGKTSDTAVTKRKRQSSLTLYFVQ